MTSEMFQVICYQAQFTFADLELMTLEIALIMLMNGLKPIIQKRKEKEKQRKLILITSKSEVKKWLNALKE